ncbi:phage holin family protein [Nocardioides yefusunii]|uniref:Phage holin family protein n=1 Tax=Nocardioides yefusunii TaxID=2500546 RepID=A0ABW1QWR6_9ACTN|nr:phage holin family protein [Nocardioides yefusunii]
MAPAPVKDSDPTIGRLIADATADISTLVSKEIQLVKSELKVSVKTSGIGIALVCAAAFLMLMFLILASITAAYLIHWGGSGLALHWGFGIVTLFYLVLGGLLALIGIKKIKKTKGPQRSIAQAKATTALLKR